MTKILDYTDKDGIKRQVLVPDHAGEEKAAQGVPWSVNLDALFPDASPELLNRIYAELWARGFVTRKDIQRASVRDLQAAVFSAHRADAFSIKAFVEESSDA